MLIYCKLIVSTCIILQTYNHRTTPVASPSKLRDNLQIKTSPFHGLLARSAPPASYARPSDCAAPKYRVKPPLRRARRGPFPPADIRTRSFRAGRADIAMKWCCFSVPSLSVPPLLNEFRIPSPRKGRHDRSSRFLVHFTAWLDGMSHMEWRETKQQLI